MSLSLVCIGGISLYMVIIGFISIKLFKSAGKAEEVMGYKLSTNKKYVKSQTFLKSSTESSTDPK